jgi:CCR4-NOT transcriptional regulation complex NOT5 subunit
VGDSNLNSGKAVDSKPAVDNPNQGASTNTPDNSANSSSREASPKAQENKASSSSNESSAKAGESSANPAPQDQSAKATPAKKKGRFHLLKKIIKPI